MYFSPGEVYTDWASDPVRGMTESEYLDGCNFFLVGHVEGSEAKCLSHFSRDDKDNNKLITYAEFVNVWILNVRFYFD